MSEVEREKILGMKASGISGAAISRSIGRSKTVINVFFFKKILLYVVNVSTQGDLVHFQRGKGFQFFDERAKKKMSSSEIVRDLNLPCISQTVRNVLSSNLKAEFKKLHPRPPLTMKHKFGHLEFTKNTLLLEKCNFFHTRKKLILMGQTAVKNTSMILKE